MIAMRLAAIRLADVSIADRFWGVMCITPAITAWVNGEDGVWRFISRLSQIADIRYGAKKNE